MRVLAKLKKNNITALYSKYIISSVSVTETLYKWEFVDSLGAINFGTVRRGLGGLRPQPLYCYMIVRCSAIKGLMWHTAPRQIIGLPGSRLAVGCRRPDVSSNVIALMLSEHKIASLSTRLVSSAFELRADSMTHISHMLISTARRLARFSGDPWRVKSNADRIETTV